MGVEELKTNIETIINKSPEDMKAGLPALFTELEEVGINNLINAYPDLVPSMMSKMYDAVNAFIQSEADIKKKVDAMDALTVAFEYTDAPFNGFMQVKDGKLSGGTELPDQYELKLVGEISEMLGSMLGGGNPMQALMSGKIKLEGNMAKAMKMMPLMTAMQKFIK